jgi:hypothetical protein
MYFWEPNSNDAEWISVFGILVEVHEKLEQLKIVLFTLAVSAI